MISKISLSFIIFFSFYHSVVNISIISSSSIDKCINTDPSAKISCKTKMLLSLTIQNAELKDSDYIETTLNQVTDKDGNVQKFSSPIKITFSKTPVKVLYQCTYFQDFNYYPKEKIISTTSSKCSDSNTAKNPTCGWAYSNGEKINYSQGFCCSCSFFSFSSSNKRGTECDGIFDMSASAHCLVYDVLWYSAYKVDKYKIEYTININLVNTTDDSIISTLELSPKDTITTNDDNTVLVKLIGDFLPVNIFPRDLSNKYLLIPTKPEEHINVKLGVDRWMLVDKERFSIDGNECDKIGVGFFAFNSQSEKCNVNVGSCLNNQIYHLFQSDIERLKNGENPEYLLIYDKNYKYSFYEKDFSSRSFSYNLEGNINTLITLEIDTSLLKFITNVSSGKILDIYVNEFMAMSDNGYMEISVMNTGYFTAQFIISYECNDQILPLSSDELSLQSEETKIFNKSLYTNTNIGKENKCMITLKNAIGKKIEIKLITFNTTNEITFNKQDKEGNTNNESIIYENKRSEFICSNYCNNPLNVLCYFENSCWKEMSKLLIFVLIGIIVFTLIFKSGKKLCCICKCIKYLFCCNFCCCKLTKKKKKNKIKSSNDDSREMENYSDDNHKNKNK